MTRLLTRTAFLVFVATIAQTTSATERPNIVFILADDLGIGDTKCYGGERCQIETPNIDALAAGGLRFTDAHVNASVCVPTRVGIMTGRYPWRFGTPERGGPWGFLGLRFPTSTFTLGKMFQAAGYRAGYVGKWHLGLTMVTKDGKVQGPTNVDYTKPVKIGPVQFGFDDSFILPGSLDMFPYAFLRNNIWQGEVTTQKGWSAFNRVGPAEKDFEDDEVLETFYQEAESFIGRQKKVSPFFLFLALTAPHTPTSPGKNWRGKSDLGVYGDFVMEVDHGVGRVRAALKRRGLDQNTLVLFASDHGAASYAGNTLKATPNQIRLLEKQGHYASGPHRGYKFSVYEGGLRVPLIANWPRKIKAGKTCDALVGLNDLMATFAEISDAKIADGAGTDSISFAPLLDNPKSSGARTNLVMQSIGPFVIRDGDWKLCLCPGSGSHGVYGNRPKSEDAWRAAVKAFGRQVTRNDLNAAPFVQLFNVSNDPHEDHNLAAKHPKRVASMVALLRQQIANGRSTAGEKLNNDRAKIPINQRLPEFVRKALN
ncbi:MAG: arylsulfatase [Planctomycetaceae bacterium]|nr:arylsulfatase [Planctomycetaceae bacterium]